MVATLRREGSAEWRMDGSIDVDKNVAAESSADSKYDPLAGTPPDKGEAA